MYFYLMHNNAFIFNFIYKILTDMFNALRINGLNRGFIIRLSYNALEAPTS